MINTVCDIASIISAAIGPDRVKGDTATCQHFSRDLFHSGKAPVCVVTPRSTEELSKVVALATANGHPVVPRGGGMSYTAGYVSDKADAVMLDLRAMNRVLTVDIENRFVVVEAGCTWEQLNEQLLAHALRTPFWGPLSGLLATVGGTVSQNSVFYGSVRHGSAAESVLGMEIVLGDGSLLKTGAWARRDGLPFTRWGGADLTGLFVGDAGAFGIKAKIALRLIPQAQSVGFASFAFADFASMLNTQADLVRAALGAETFGIDAYKAKNSAQTGKKLAEAAKTAIGVLKKGSTILAGIKDVAGMALAGTDDIESAAYSLHLTVEGISDRDTDEQLKQVQEIAKRNGGTSLHPVIPKAMRGRPFPQLRSVLSGDGRRWVPVHGILPLGNAVAAVAAAEAAMAKQQQDMDHHGVFYSPLTASVPNGILYEPCFYWEDAITSLHIEALENDLPNEWRNRPNREDARAFVLSLWHEVAAVLAKYGAVNFQIGRAYPHVDELPDPYVKLLRSIKQCVDPKGLTNPEVLGLDNRETLR